MKKIIALILTSIALASYGFCQENSNDWEYDISDNEKRSESSPNLVFAPGIKLSIMGLEPTFNVCIENLELEAACAFSTGIAGEDFGFAPSFSIGYNTKPYGRGVAAVFGGEYQFISPMYVRMIYSMRNSKNDDSSTVRPSAHAVSWFYKGVIHFTPTVGITWKFKLPILIGGSENGNTFSSSLLNLTGFGECSLISLCTISFGVQFAIAN